jgi:tRNA threonylcarbamoyladenosine biosynthesis protein TsaB
MGWAASTSYELATIGGLAAPISHPTLIAGDLAPADREQLAALTEGKAVLLPPALSTRRPGCLAEIAWGRFAAGERDDLAALSPIYLHEPS